MILRAALLALLPLPALGQGLPFPAPAEVTADRAEPMASHALPIGPWADGALPTRRVEGALRQTAWRLTAPGMPTLAVLQPLRAALIDEGYALIFECETQTCGGFDFRFATEILPAPAMHVDLGDFRFVALARGEDEVASLMVSRGGDAAYVQLTRVQAADADDAAAETFPSAPPAPAPTGAPADALPDVAASLAAAGVVVLEDLAFASGSADLGNGAFASLDRLADYLRANPAHRVTVVGHTDSVGGLEGNIALSQRRAASVVERLVAAHGIPSAQLSAAGAGYLAPRASNLTEEGRALNRRVEVVVTAVE